MSNILQWSTDSSGFWGHASARNVGNIREDLQTLSNRIDVHYAFLQSKAEAAQLASHGRAVEKATADAAALRVHVDQITSTLRAQLLELGQWLESQPVEKQLERLCREQLKAIDELCCRHREFFSSVVGSIEAERPQAERVEQGCAATLQKLVAEFMRCEDFVRESTRTAERLDRELRGLATETESTHGNCARLVKEGIGTIEELKNEQRTLLESAQKAAEETQATCRRAENAARTAQDSCREMNRALGAEHDRQQEFKQELDAVAANGKESARAADQTREQCAQLLAETAKTLAVCERRAAQMEELAAKAHSENENAVSLLQQSQDLVKEERAAQEAWEQRMSEKLNETERHRQRTEELAAQVMAQLHLINWQWGTFWRRLKWVLRGSPPLTEEAARIDAVK